MGRSVLVCRNYPCGPRVQVLICTDVPNYYPSEAERRRRRRAGVLIEVFGGLEE